MDTPQYFQPIRNAIQAREAKAKARQGKNPLGSQRFAYHPS
jgi:hypothetical protein